MADKKLLVRNLQSSLVAPHNIVLTWLPPKQHHQEEYTVTYYNNAEPSKKFYIETLPSATYSPNSLVSVLISNILSGNYTFEVSVLSNGACTNTLSAFASTSLPTALPG